ncbi:MAG: succinate dehydrogenase/fumarate reductase iron-sulfur subunit [Balneolales bacterium]
MSKNENMTIYLKVWRQKNAQTKGQMVDYTVEDVNPDMSFLEMFDWLNERLILTGEEPIEFDHDCREGICGSCNMVIDGMAHGPEQGTAACQLHMRHYKDGDTIVVEPWRAKAFPAIKDLVVDRSALDRIIGAGGYVSVKTGSAVEANTHLVPKGESDIAFDYATCIGCGACVAACPNSSASLFTGAKVAQLAHLPQGDPERGIRATRMVEQMDIEGFGDCSNHGECEAVCPVEISITAIAEMRREYVKGLF